VKLRTQQKFKKKVLAAKMSKCLKLLPNFLPKSNMLENIHESKLLQPITAFDEGEQLFRTFKSHVTTA